MKATSLLTGLLLLCVGTATVSGQVIWEENFDGYTAGEFISVAGVGNGWETWGLDPAVDSLIVDGQAQTAPNSLFVENNQDVVQTFTGLDSGRYVVKASVWIDATQAGDAYFIMLNDFTQPAGPFNWSVQLRFNALLGDVADLGGSAGGPPGGGTLPLPVDQWNEIEIQIDLDNNLHNIYFNGTALRECELWSGGLTEIQCIDLYAAAGVGNGVYFDDLSVELLASVPCDVPSALTCDSVGCSPGPGDIELTWANTSTYDNIEVYRNGTLIATLGGTDTSYTDAAQPSGNYTYEIVGLCGLDSSCPASCSTSHCPGALDDSILMLNWTTGTTNLADGVNAWADDNGWSVTQVLDGASLLAELNGAFIYEVVVYENPCCASAGEIASLIDYINAGGKVLCSYWDLDIDPAFQAALGVDSAVDFTTPQVVYTWDSAHPIWDGLPNPIEVSGLDPWLDNGDLMEPAAGGTAIAGFSGAAFAGQAGVIIGNSGNTIANGFQADDMSIEVSDLVYNEMEFLAGGGPTTGPQFIRGDCNNDGGFDISDAVSLLSSLFVPGSPSPVCADAADSNDDGGVDISDAVYKLSALFVPGSPSPAAPNPNCGEDPTEDPPGSGGDLGCDQFDACP